MSDSMTAWTIQSLGFSGPVYWSGQLLPSPRDLSKPGIEPRSPALQADSLPAEPPWKPKNTGVGSLSLLQRIFLTQELNWGLSNTRTMNHELPDVQAGFRKGRGTRNQIVNIHWIIEKTREFQKNIYFCSIDYAKAFDCMDQNKLENSEREGNIRPPDLPLEKSICRSGSNS